MMIHVCKYSASGNDFLITHTFKKKNRSELAKHLCDRHNGVGADGFIVLVPHSEYDFEWEFYNSDGSIAEMCGNGSRAASLYALKHGLCQNSLSFLTLAGKISATVSCDIVETELTEHKFIKDNISEFGFEWKLVNTGVPHLVTFTDSLYRYNKDIAKELREKYNANVNFAMLEDGVIRVRTYERGVEDETLACGTGMAGCFLVANSLKMVGDSAKVYPKSEEELTLSIKNEKLFFKGKVQKIFDTFIKIKGDIF